MAEWEKEVRRIARKRATKEARVRWGMAKGEPIAFNFRWEHVKAVVGLAARLAEALDADRDVVVAAAWLHDICKLSGNHGVNGAEKAQFILEQIDFPTEKIEAVTEAIAQHVGLHRQPDAPPLQPLSAAILWDADKLSKLGVQSIVYSMMTPEVEGATLSKRRVSFDKFARTALSRTVESMNTEPARVIAERRYQEMMAVLATWRCEEDEQRAPKPGAFIES